MLRLQVVGSDLCSGEDDSLSLLEDRLGYIEGISENGGRFGRDA